LLNATVNLGLGRDSVIPDDVHIAGWVCNVVPVQMVPYGIPDKARSNPAIRQMQRSHGL
jgi:hypothetical protein